MTTQGPTSAQNWKGRRTPEGHEVQVPSGNVALCRRPGLDTFMKLGMIPNSLLGIIQVNIQKAQTGEAPSNDDIGAQMAKLVEDPTKLVDVLDFADRVVCFICIAPKVQMPPEEGVERDLDVLYADEVDMEDKMFLFQWAVGGTESVETFRAETGPSLGTAHNSQNVVDATQ